MPLKEPVAGPEAGKMGLVIFCISVQEKHPLSMNNPTIAANVRSKMVIGPTVIVVSVFPSGFFIR
jgi:hypothetical protein